MADRPRTNRSQFYKQVLLKPGRLAYLAAWSVISNSDTISEKIIKPNVSTETWKKMESYLVTTTWHWYVWAIGALLIMLAGAVESGYRLNKAAQDRARKAIADLEEVTKPRLAILWHPGGVTYHFEYVSGQNPVPSIHFRICIENISKTTEVDGIRVVLERLTPHRLPCVPCSLRLMNNILMPPAPDPRIERFSLNPGDRQFIDLMEQKPGTPAFNIWHTVVPQITTQVPAQAYTMRILVTASNAPSVSRDFELVENGLVWNLRAINGYFRVNSASSSASNSFCADCLISREYLTSRAGAFQAGRAVLLVGNAFFLPARFRHKAVPEVLPDGPVLFQVD